MPPIGQLRKRLELQAPTDSTDAYGQPTRSWVTYATVWAHIEPTGGGEPAAGNEQQLERTHRITIRHRAGVESTHRGLYGARVLNFDSVINVDELNVWLLITATERTG